MNLGELAPLLSGADDKDRAGIRNRLRYVLEKTAVLGYSVSRAFGAVMNVPDRVIRADDGLVRLFDVEVKDARFRVIDPHDGMKMMGHCDLPARIHLAPSRREGCRTHLQRTLAP